MGKGYKKLKRSKPQREYRKVIHVIMEGRKTEPLYFGILKRRSSNYQLELYPANDKTSPEQLLQKAKEILSKKNLRKKDEIWIVIDADNNNKSCLQKIYEWSEESEYFGLAFSNPCFEYWLLLHFEPFPHVNNVKDCSQRLKKYLPNFSKNNLDGKKLEPRISVAVNNAKNKYQQCEDWYKDYHTTIFLLIEKFL